MRKARICLMLGILFFSFIFTSQNAHAWLSGWNYRKAITVNNTQNTNILTNYQVPVNLTYDTDMQPDFSDIRFTNSSDSLLSYWIESQSNSNWAYVWVKVPSIPASSTTTIHVYYGNTTVVNSASVTNLDTVFIKGRDFRVNSTTSDLTITFTGGTLIYDSNGYVNFTEGSGRLENTIYFSSPSFSTASGLVFVAKTKRLDDNSAWLGEGNLMWNSSAGGGYGYTVNFRRTTTSGNYNYLYITKPNVADINNTVTLNRAISTWGISEMKIYGSSITGKYFSDADDGTLVTTATATDSSYSSGYLGVWNAGGGYNLKIQVQYFFARAYASPEPTYSVGAEETAVTNTAPQYSNVLVSPSSPQTYGINDIWFNITWTDSDGISKAWITHNFAGTSQNYTMSNDTASHFYYHLTFTPAARTYSYTFYANDTLGATNSTSGSYTINKALSGTTLTIFTPSPIVYETQTTTYCTDNNPEADANLYRNGTLANNENNTAVTLPAGTHTYVCNVTETQNYTSGSTSYTYEVSKKPLLIRLAINGTEADTTVVYPNTTNTTAWLNVSSTVTGSLHIYRNGSDVSNPEIIKLATGTYNYTASFNDSQNYTFSPVTRILTVNKGDSQLSLTASPNWNVAGETQVTITCSANSALNVTLYKDSVLVANPYTAVLPFGIYNFVCNISDQQNYTPPTTSQYLYVTTGGLGCTDNSTYAFKSVVSTSFPVNLNFTSLVGRNFVKPDLSDVWVNTSILTTNKNTTNGYYLVVTNTTPLSNFTLYFGNYLGNQSYTNAAMAANTIDISYQENSPYYYIALVNENDGTSLLPPSANTTMVLYCSKGVSSFKVDNITFLVATYEQLSSLRAIVAYSASDIYYRDYIVQSPVEFRNLYLVDATKNQVLQMLFRLTDNTGNFGNSTFRVKKYLGGNVITINEIKFDVENKAIVYLMNGGKYTLYVDNGVEERAIGELYPDPSDLQKYIILNEITAFNVSTANVTHSLTFIDGVFNFVWADPTGQTIMVEFYVYNYTDQSVLFAANSTNKTYINFVYTVPDKYATYTAKYVLHHGFYGEHTDEYEQNYRIFGKVIENPLSTLIVSLGGGEIFFFLIFVVSIPMFFAQRFAGVGAIVLLIVVAFLAYTGLYNIANSASGIALLGIALFFAIVIEYQQRKRYRE